MSGGHWNYAGDSLRGTLRSIGLDESARKHWPTTCAMFRALAEPLRDAEHDMDWALSGDTSISSVSDTELAAKLRIALRDIIEIEEVENDS